MKLKIGIIGLGYWGPINVRNFRKNSYCEVVWCCDVSDTALTRIKKDYPEIKQTKKYQDILTDALIDCVAIATPPATHYSIAKEALKAGKHVFIAKPLSLTSKEAIELTKLAKKQKRILFSDLTYLYTSAITYIQKYIDKGSIGKPFYYDSVRSNLGIIQKDVNVIWDLAPHDLAIIDFCFGLTPKSVFATASKHYKNSLQEEMAHITIQYEKNFTAHIHVSWVSPVKLRTILIGGDKKMIYFNDVVEDEKVKIYNKGVDINKNEITPFKPLYRSGDILIPTLPAPEALSDEIADFIKQILNKKPNTKNMERDIRIIKILEACSLSVKTGKPVLMR